MTGSYDLGLRELKSVALIESVIGAAPCDLAIYFSFDERPCVLNLTLS